MLGRGDLVLQPRKCLLAVDENLEGVAVASRGIARAPEPVVRRVVGALPAVPFQAAPVVPDDEPLGAASDRSIELLEFRVRHSPASVSAQTPDRAR